MKYLCPILERTGDGSLAGRCWYHSPGGVCPRHGDVMLALTIYHEEGTLTDEKDHPRRPPQSIYRSPGLQPEPPRGKNYHYLQLIQALRGLIDR